ncbi:type II toxin-antitoxin system mRNA interferase toxin, RelE/StbE family [Lysobacteraceae bacterium NML95-0200]|nr:type II toxin-antitoxin system mRNA interferase toxin, RelE/StbE family [Xanthomonadaceae bacterium NML95-0200]
MLLIEWSKEAAADVAGIIEYVAERNPKAANELEQRIADCVERLAAWPMMCRPGRIAGTREYVITSSYVLVYRVTERLDILRVIHTSREYP